MTNEEMMLNLNYYHKKLRQFLDDNEDMPLEQINLTMSEDDNNFAKLYAKAMGLGINLHKEIQNIQGVVTPEMYEKKLLVKNPYPSKTREEQIMFDMLNYKASGIYIHDNPRPVVDLEVDPAWHDASIIQKQEEIDESKFTEKAFDKLKSQDGKIIFSQIPF